MRIKELAIALDMMYRIDGRGFNAPASHQNRIMLARRSFKVRVPERAGGSIDAVMLEGYPRTDRRHRVPISRLKKILGRATGAGGP